MSTKTAISITINQSNDLFLKSLTENIKTSKSEIINNIIDQYRKFRLKKELIQGFKSHTAEDVQDAMVDFDDYLENIDKAN